MSDLSDKSRLRGSTAPMPGFRVQHSRKPRYGTPRCFVPFGRTGFALYVVVLVDHLDLVKIGQTRNWNRRKREYTEWNLRSGDGIEKSCVFHITDEYCDLLKLENAVLNLMPIGPAMRREWFKADFEETCKLVENFLISNDISYLSD